jgi:hypothetical protein
LKSPARNVPNRITEIDAGNFNLPPLVFAKEQPGGTFPSHHSAASLMQSPSSSVMKATAMLSEESAAADFVRYTFGHLKAIGADKGGRTLLKTANIGRDAGVVDANDKDAFIAAAKTGQRDREKSVRTLA